MSTSRRFRLGTFIQATGHHVSDWRHPDATASTTHEEPYTLVRKFASLN